MSAIWPELEEKMLLLEFLKYRREYPIADTQIFSVKFSNVFNSKDKIYPASVSKRIINEL
jgi:hypothetical protein